MQFVISSSALGDLRKSHNASPLKGAKRVGGHGPSHEGSHWLREAATVKSALGDYGVRDGIVVARQTNQLKIWAPGLGMFVVDASAASPSNASVPWDRKKAEGTSPVTGSLVNVRREGDKSQWFARLEEPLDDKAPGDTVMVSRGTLGRKMERLEVSRASILGPHIPTKIKDADGAFVKDATSRRGASPSLLQEVLAPAAKWRDAPAIEWVHSLKRGRREQILAGEAEWFKSHQDDVVRLAVAQAIRAGLHDPAQVEDVVSEAFYGALSGLRLWAKRPAKQRAMMQRKMLERFSPAQVEAMDDEALRTQRALMRAFAKARAAVIPGEEDFIDAGALDWDEMPDQDAERAGTPIYDGGGENYAATVIQTEVADAAKLSPAARFLLSHAIDQGWALNGDGSGPPPEEAGEVARILREQHGVVHASATNVPGMWLFVKNRLRDAVRQDPALLSTLHVPRRGRDQTLAKSLFTSEMVDELDKDGRTERISAIFKAFEASFEKSLEKSFDPLKHPHGAHGWWAHVVHSPHDDGARQGTPSVTPLATPPANVPAPNPPAPTRLPRAQELYDDQSTQRLLDWYHDNIAPTPDAIAGRLAEIEPGRRHRERFSDWLQVWSLGRTGDRSNIDPRLIALHLSAAAEFNAPSPFLAREQNYEAVKKILAEQEGRMRAFLRAMHAFTQQELSQNGVTGAVLWRGLKGEVPGYKLPKDSGFAVGPMPNNPIASFTLLARQAARFAGAETGAINLTYASAPRLLGTPFTGFGVLPQTEVITTGNGGDQCYWANWKTASEGEIARNRPLAEWVKLIQQVESHHE